MVPEPGLDAEVRSTETREHAAGMRSTPKAQRSSPGGALAQGILSTFDKGGESSFI
jgi:hypothetical protein